MSTLDELREVRKKKLEDLVKGGINPYPASAARTFTIREARAMEDKELSLVGRIIGLRGHGKIVFADLKDDSGQIQVVWKADFLSDEVKNLLTLLDIGDFVSVTGKIGKTQAGEISIFASATTLLSKSLRPLPDKWYGLSDVEERYRQRYVDLLVNEDVRPVFELRARVIRFLRTFLDHAGFLEVETPVLQPIYGGASAKPFITHHNSLDADMYLRIAVELYLKRLIVGGFEKVYEIGKNFRNEGMGRGHNPEFTMLEFYWAYADYGMLMEYTQVMLSKLTSEVLGSTKLKYEGKDLDFTPPWPKKTYREVMLEYTGIDIDEADTEEKLTSAIKQKKITVDLTKLVGYGAILDELYKTMARPNLIGPMFLTDRPTAFVTLAKRLPDDPRYTASFQLLIAGEEIVNAYNELNDPIDQEKRWRESEKLGKRGQAEAEAFDDDYIRALEYGMPPTAGWGMGIDRLVAILANQHSLKDVILFPTLRPIKPVKKNGKKIKSVQKAEPAGITKKQALKLLQTHTQNQNLRRHGYAVAAVMKALAVKLGGNPGVWEIIGLLHDADWEETKDTPEEHTKKTISWLSDLGLKDGSIVQALKTHNTKYTKLAEVESPLEWALETCDELTGFIIAVALVRPEKKLDLVTVESVMKKWKAKEFARAVNRAQIEACEEKLDIPLIEFIKISLEAMKEIHEDLGL